MADFKIGQPIETTDPRVEVTIGPNTTIPVGVHRFQLVVVDNEGNSSVPAVAEVLIKDLARPTARIEAVPKEVEFGKTFMLNGAGSADVPPGRVVKFIWTRLD